MVKMSESKAGANRANRGLLVGSSVGRYYGSEKGKLFDSRSTRQSLLPRSNFSPSGQRCEIQGIEQDPLRRVKRVRGLLGAFGVGADAPTRGLSESKVRNPFSDLSRTFGAWAVIWGGAFFFTMYCCFAAQLRK